MTRMTALVGATLAVLPALTALPAPAAEPACADRGTVLQRLAKDFAEQPVAMGLASNGAVIELFNSNGHDSWTIVMTMPTGKSCLMAAGKDWETVVPKLAMGPDA